MPELPEVETTARYLETRLRGRKVISAQVRWARSVACPSAAQFCKNLPGSKVISVGRRGKYLVLRLERKLGAPMFLLGHLRMSGSMDVVSRKSDPSTHDRVLIRFDNDKELRFNDPRKFGRLYLLESPESVLASLGPEPLSDQFSVAWLAQALAGRRTKVKSLLLDQTFLAGVGNIYADESLWSSGIHPLRSASSLSLREARSLHSAIRAVLRKAIKFQGTDIGDSVVDYGRYEPRVYGREGKPCHKCATDIMRIVVGQRGTHYCPACQK